MWVEHIDIKNCRSLKKVSLNLSPHLNLIIGENASGKTSFLEALSLLSTGRSFRTSHISEVIEFSSSSVLVSAKIISDEIHSQIGIEKSPKITRIRINKKDIYSQAELSIHMPITCIHPGSIEMITGSPFHRRSYIDWISFYLFPDFLNHWKEYKHILKQRNICLKNLKHRYALSDWTVKLVDAQPLINQYRMDALRIIEPILTKICNKLLHSPKIELNLKTGFPVDVRLDKTGLLRFYEERLNTDIKSQRTTYGIHRSDLDISLNGVPAKECGSRGQLKLLVISLLIAQSTAIKKTNGNGILLIDDIAAELDGKNKETLLNYLGTIKQQLFITSTSEIEIPEIDHKVFHVKHGGFTVEK